MQSKGNTIRRFEDAGFDERFRYYIGLVSSNNPIDALKSSYHSTSAVLEQLSLDRWNYRYAPGKWSIAELVLHVIDTERIMSTRALRFARGEQQVLSGFNHLEYVVASNADGRAPEGILSEYYSVRSSTLALYSGMGDEMLQRKGRFSDNELVSVASLGLLMAGHDAHHLAVLEQSYLS